MKNAILILLSAVLLTACNDSTDETTKWRQENIDAYQAIVDDDTWAPLPSDTIAGWPRGVYYKDITPPETQKGLTHPLQTSSVTVKYRGYFLNDTTNLFNAETTSTFALNSVVRGFSVALQNMVVGEKWQLCIPEHLGYGTSTSGSVKAYSTLFFDVQLLNIKE
ncbi:MAG: FKBP-type peptidyl-prolyl cis-trans isomerase [Candidatus Symbiothrix sp.]|jgi:FKBP-type peptidyl-prolyl cis-trans isomerase FklB|nr:FKBP-type peptidyl-prolyl cis-trans isomerase [Candidatus Symbiothrix sp.]